MNIWYNITLYYIPNSNAKLDEWRELAKVHVSDLFDEN
jgi:hypothetical protein